MIEAVYGGLGDAHISPPLSHSLDSDHFSTIGAASPFWSFEAEVQFCDTLPLFMIA
jgi:hypothetical protein